MIRTGFFQQFSDVFTDSENLPQIQAAIIVARSSDTYQRNVAQGRSLSPGSYSAFGNHRWQELISAALLASESIPVTSYPCFARHAAVTEPTYPIPNIVTFVTLLASHL